jgi:YVTN family beta-propeller protein
MDFMNHHSRLTLYRNRLKGAVVLAIGLVIMSVYLQQRPSADEKAKRFLGPTSSQPLALTADEGKVKDDKKKDATASHSTTIALTSDEERVVVVNREANSVSILRVKDQHGDDIGIKIAEIGVGEEPRCVAIHPNDQVAYVTNGISGTVSVVNLAQRKVVATIRDVGTEPRGCALTPNGTLLYVANHTEGTVAIIKTASSTLWGR